MFKFFPHLGELQAALVLFQEVFRTENDEKRTHTLRIFHPCFAFDQKWTENDEKRRAVWVWILPSFLGQIKNDENKQNEGCLGLDPPSLPRTDQK